MVTAIDHINIVVSDLERSVKFYTELLDFKLFKKAHLQGAWIEAIVGLKDVSADVAYVRAPAGEPRIELLCYKRPIGEKRNINSKANTIGLRHIALQVSDIYALAQKLKDNDVQLLGEPVVVPETAVAHEQGQKILLYFYDPDGVLLELAEYR